MTDLATTIEPKSDQMNADDLIAGPVTIKVTKVSKAGTPEQPISINFEGDNNKPYKPCKGMRRVLVQTWGRDGANYAGRSMTLFRDEKVKWGGVEVGGIRISHLSDISEPITMALTASKTSRKPYTVQPLKVTAAKKPDDLETRRTALIKYFDDMKVSEDRICAAVGKQTISELGKTEMDKLSALAASVKSGDKSLLEAFPLVDHADPSLFERPTDDDAERAAIASGV